MSLTTRVYGDKLDLADELRDEFVQGAKDAVRDGAGLLLAESKRLITRFGPGPAPADSTPGTVTGNLLKLTKARAAKLGRGRASAVAAIQYAPHSFLLEYGHDNADGTRTLPRPFVRPAVENTEGAIDRLLRERLG
jgi:hypothetical protein